MTLKQNALNIADAFTKWKLWKDGGSSGSAIIKESILYDGVFESGSITLEENVNNYDILFVIFQHPLNLQTWQYNYCQGVVYINALDKNSTNGNIQFNYSNYYLILNIIDNNVNIISKNALNIYKIIGVKITVGSSNN